MNSDGNAPPADGSGQAHTPMRDLHTGAALESIGALVESYCGIVLEGAYRLGLRDAVLRRAQALGCEDAATYLALLRDPAHEELARLTDCLTITETSFFRNQAHFRALAEVILPALASTGEDVFLWSAGCATGEEAYSLAIACLEAGLPRPGRRVLVRGTDINRTALAAAERGEYGERRMAGVPPALRDRYFERVGNRWRVNARVRALLSWSHHNLLAARPPVPPASMDVIFCQQVAIYFRPEVVREVSKRLVASLKPGGYLFPGFSETAWHATQGLSMVSLGDCFLHRKEDPSAPRPSKCPRDSRAPRSGEGTFMDAAAHLAAAQREASAGNTKDALAHATRSVALDPLSSAAWGLLGLLHRDAGHVEDAERAFRRQLYLEPESALAHFHLASLLREAGSIEEARRAYARAARLLQVLPPQTVLGGVTADLLLSACRQYADAAPEQTPPAAECDGEHQP